MTVKDAIERVLREAGTALHYREITRRALTNGYWTTTGKTPEATISANLSTSPNRFRKVSPGTYDIVFRSKTSADEEVAADIDDDGADELEDQPAGQANQLSAKSGGLYSFLDAAELILKRPEHASGLHYRDITDIAIAEQLIATAGLTPEASMSAQIGSEIARRKASGVPQRFEKVGRGIYSLAAISNTSLERVVESNNMAVREQLLNRLKEVHPREFEAIISVLLERLGFEEVLKTNYSSDGGIDVYGNLIVAGVIRTRMAVQVKRHASNIQRPTVQQVRGSLGVHDQGLIITTGGFSKGAIEEAEKPNAVRVALMDGRQLVDQLIEHGIGVNKTHVTILELSEDPLTNEDA